MKDFSFPGGYVADERLFSREERVKSYFRNLVIRVTFLAVSRISFTSL
jgi:hypothetical protein